MSRGWRKIVESRWFIIGGVIIFILLVLAYSRAWYREYQIQKEISRLEQQADVLTAKKLFIQDQLTYAQSPAYVEAKARTELNLVKEGEHMMVVSNPASKPLENNPQSVVQSSVVSNPLKWLHYFIH